MPAPRTTTSFTDCILRVVRHHSLAYILVLNKTFQFLKENRVATLCAIGLVLYTSALYQSQRGWCEGAPHERRPMESSDIVIVGAGIIGLSIAFQLARRTRARIVVLE